MKKHAFLIMAHHRLDILNELIKSLDYNNNDIFIHIDIKCEEDYSHIQTKNANLYFIDRMDVRWGGYSQIQCEINLLKDSIKGNYAYYHLLTGVSYPIKSNDYIHKFFDESNKEFVGFDDKTNFDHRLKYRYLFNELGKVNTFFKKVLYSIRRFFNMFQKILKFNRFKKYNMICKKGFVYWSITNELAKYIVSQESKIYDICKYSLCGDEVFMQTFLYNSKFKNNVYDFNDEFNGCMRICPWESSEVGLRDGYNFEIGDVDYLINSKYIFALKFEKEDSIETIKLINKRIQEVNDEVSK